MSASTVADKEFASVIYYSTRNGKLTQRQRRSSFIKYVMRSLVIFYVNRMQYSWICQTLKCKLTAMADVFILFFTQYVS